ncbi:LLM class F420-dependent oxidoreductase [Mycolicibacterium anyangense]|uniref:LLM class F420-dependent oxidoreductase n=1 Tax=Mycolicibacterium anyangense TaxID=1431246 RepID=A0A6N4WFQ7_9MYCO|nr:TIGR03617 family F420-dependent LLM class oxidoreductase [Mycolicibacterium anyangense]BBZ78041.1 LLM class F420-dependent oxidoreductase [Mycolicibacterium anyangense]
MKVHLQVDGDPRRVLDSARSIVQAGADGAFSFEGQHDVFLPLVLSAVETDLEVMTNVAIAGPRSPLHLAHAAYDLQSYSGGRFRLGLGSQIRVHIEKRYSGRWEKPAARVAETVAAVKAIFAAWEGQAPLDFRGEFYTHTLMPANFNPGPNPYGPPAVLMGGLGPVMTRKAAEVADGLLVMPFTSTRFFAEQTMTAVTDGLRRAGRVDHPFPIIAQVMVAMGSIDTELRKAIDLVAFLIGFYGSTPNYRRVLDIEGWGELQPRLNALSKGGNYPEMRELVSDDMVDTYGVVGTPRQCAEQIYRRFGDHASEVCCYFPGYKPSIADLSAFVRSLHDLPSPSETSSARADLRH